MFVYKFGKIRTYSKYKKIVVEIRILENITTYVSLFIRMTISLN